MSIFKKTKASYRWVRALSLASNEEYFDALVQIENIENMFPIKGEVKLFKGYLHYALGDYILALNNFSSSMDDIDKSNIYSEDEKEYLKCYASVFGFKCLEKTDYGVISPFQINYELFKLDKVSKAVKNNFPLRSHPKWGKN